MMRTNILLHRGVTRLGLAVLLALCLTACGDDGEKGSGSPAQNACEQSGGTVLSQLCCASAGDFPNTCSIGACGCPPSASADTLVCDCGSSRCFDGTTCVDR
jgi:hypothetical protein